MRYGYLILLLILTACDKSEDPIAFITNPNTMIDHNRMYVYPFEAVSTSNSPISYSLSASSWLELNTVNNEVIGTAGWENRNKTFHVVLTATDGTNSGVQEFNISVNLGEIICETTFGNPAESDYIMPYLPGNSYKIIQGYCPPNPNWGHHNWFAYDFDMQIGDTVIASRAGEVIIMQEDKPDNVFLCGGGTANYVFIKHPDQTVMEYVHLTTNGALVAVGDQVKQGQPIGLSGNSGCSSGPHLHVSLYRDRTSFDKQASLPLNYRNLEGELNQNNGLVQDKAYKALSFIGNGN